jgi:hypothetical protein
MDKEYITLIPARVGNSVEWTMVYGSHVGQGGNYPDIDLDSPTDYRITYTIADVNKLGIKFDPAVVDAAAKPKAINGIWMVEGSGAQKHAGAYPLQIDGVGLQKSGTELVVTDKNSEAVTLTYKLNFVGPAELGTITPIDPEIRNGGGNGGIFANFDIVNVLLGGAVLALTALLWVSHFRGRRTTAQNPAAGESRRNG